MRGIEAFRTPWRRGAAVLVIAVGAAAWPALADDTKSAGAEALAPFKKALMQALQGGLQSGPVDAVETCQLEAPAVAAAHSKQGVRVGRTSHRLRNPANASPGWVEPILERYLADAAARSPQSVDLEGGRRGYVEPITMQPLCLTCHGSALAPDVAAKIATLYPDDRATGFEVGDLRGVFWIELPPRP